MFTGCEGFSFNASGDLLRAREDFRMMLLEKVKNLYVMLENTDLGKGVSGSRSEGPFQAQAKERRGPCVGYYEKACVGSRLSTMC